MSSPNSAAREDIIEVLACEIDARPKSAPGPEQLASHVRGATRGPGSLLVYFDDEAAEVVAAFVEAERVCCAGIDWRIERGPGLRLRISAEDGQLAAIESLWKK